MALPELHKKATEKAYIPLVLSGLALAVAANNVKPQHFAISGRQTETDVAGYLSELWYRKISPY